MRRPKSNSRFTHFAKLASHATGQPITFITAVIIIVGWAITGPIFHFSDTWQLVINTSTTIITFLMVFLIQNTQNRDAVAIHIKLDELIRALKGARNKLVDLEELSDRELEQIQQEFHRLGAEPPMAPRSHHARKKSVEPTATSPGEGAHGSAPLADEPHDPDP